MRTKIGVCFHGQKQQGGLERGESGGVAAWKMRWRWAPGQFWKGLWAREMSSHQEVVFEFPLLEYGCTQGNRKCKAMVAVSQGCPGIATLALSQVLTLHSQKLCCEEAWATHRGHIEMSGPRSHSLQNTGVRSPLGWL